MNLSLNKPSFFNLSVLGKLPVARHLKELPVAEYPKELPVAALEGGSFVTVQVQPFSVPKMAYESLSHAVLGDFACEASSKTVTVHMTCEQ